jgi:REP element-mobilizing transposase RayT
MARPSRAEVFDPDEVAIAHVFNRTVRHCFLMGDDTVSGKNFDHRKAWFEDYLRQFAAFFGIDLTCYAIMSNHFHLILRSPHPPVPTRCRRHLGQPGSRQTLVDDLPRAPFGRYKTPATKRGRD